MIRRRKFLHWSTASGAAIALGAAPWNHLAAQDAVIESRGIGAGTTLFTGSGCNVVVNKAGNGELLISDGGLAANAPALLRSIVDTTGSGNIATLMNTHWHREHTGLNEELGSRGVRIFAHEGTRQWLGTTIERPWDGAVFEPLPESARPSEVFYHYGDFQHGATKVEYGYLRQAHTDGDMYVFLPQDNVLHAAIVSSDAWPLMDWWTGGWITGLVEGLDTLLSIANENTVIVPATGPVLSRAELATMRDMFGGIATTVRDRFMKASTAAETVAAKLAATFEAQYGNADQFIELSHWSLIPHITPDA